MDRESFIFRDARGSRWRHISRGMLMVAAIVVITAWACSSRAQEGYQQLEGILGDAPVNPSLIGHWLLLQDRDAGGDEYQGGRARGGRRRSR